MSDDWVRHWMSNPDGASRMRSAAHTLIVIGTAEMRAGCTDDAEDCFRIAADLLVTANDSEAGVYDD